MGITSELRAFIDAMDKTRPYEAERLCKVADRIDAEYDEVRGFCERLEGAATDREDVTLWGVDYTALPLDADGVPIRIGDELEGYGYPNGGAYCKAIVGEWGILAGEQECNYQRWLLWSVDAVRHHHAPTVEDVLREFGKAWAEWEDGAAMMNPVETFASKLRLAEGEGA